MRALVGASMRIRIHHLVAQAAAARPDAPALSHKHVTLTYAQLWHAAGSAAGLLAGLGLRRGERVAVYLDKRPETVAAIVGTSLADGVVVPVNPLLKARQVAHILGDCDVRVLVTSAERLDLLTGELDACEALEHAVVVGGDPPRGPRSRGPVVTSWQAPGQDSAAPGQVPPATRGGTGDVGVDGDLAAILYTSGSTGRPKGVVLSHRNLVVGAESVSHYLGNTADDV
ncbi:MAG: AMP-binding protein, partial [Actinomycetales bacterium]